MRKNGKQVTFIIANCLNANKTFHADRFAACELRVSQITRTARAIRLADFAIDTEADPYYNIVIDSK